MIITKEDVERLTEEELMRLREINQEEMANEYKQGALLLPTGIPTRCKVDQPGDQISSPPIFRQGDEQFTNGVTRNTYFDGKDNKFTALGFAGRARISRESVTVR